MAFSVSKSRHPANRLYDGTDRRKSGSNVKVSIRRGHAVSQKTERPTCVAEGRRGRWGCYSWLTLRASCAMSTALGGPAVETAGSDRRLHPRVSSHRGRPLLYGPGRNWYPAVPVFCTRSAEHCRSDGVPEFVAQADDVPMLLSERCKAET